MGKTKTLPDTVPVELQDTDKISVDSNVRVTMVDRLLVIIVDTEVDLGPSTTGKMITVGSSHGFQQFPGDLRGNIYIG
jgi:hypothetical protein